MITEIKIPQLGTNEEKGTLLEWFVKDKSQVKRGQAICSFETSKIVFEIEAPRGGYLRIDRDTPQELSIQTVIGWIVESPDEKISKIMNGKARPDKTCATKKARILAESLGMDIENIPHRGIIKEKDVQNYIENTKGRKLEGKRLNEAPVDINRDLIKCIVVMDSIQKKVCEKISRSFRNNLSAYLSVELNIEGISDKLQKIVNATKKIVRLNDLIIKATSYALEQLPLLNAFYWENKIVYYNSININVIMDHKGSLSAPVIMDANKRTIEEIAHESSMLQMKLLRNQLTPGNFANGTFTVTNLSSFGVQNFMPVINDCQSAILGVSSERNICILDKQNLKQTKVMNLELTYDHRIINGIIGANFLNIIKKYINSFRKPA